jgi:hypothetical protein
MSDNPYHLCRYCGVGIAKKTKHYSFRYNNEGGRAPDAIQADEPITHPSQLTKFTNQGVVSVRYRKVGNLGRCIDSFTTWDGESYVDPFFCNGNHAKLFAYALAGEGRAMPEYNEAMAWRIVTEEEAMGVLNG